VGRAVTWSVPVASREIVTLTIEARAVITTQVINTATFSNPQQILSGSVQVLVYADQVYLPIVLK